MTRVALRDKMARMMLKSSWLVEILKALGHPVRLRIVAVLAQGELCVCQLAALVGQAFSTVSTHLSQLRRAGLLQERKEGRWVYYRLAPLEGFHKQILDAVLLELSQDPEVQSELRLASKLRATPPSELFQSIVASTKRS